MERTENVQLAAPWPSLDDRLVAGARAGEYVVEGLVATGGYGSVYRARHDLLGREAALKVMHAELAASPKMIERFLREARTHGRLDHPNIVRIYDIGRLDDQRPWFAMELLRGTDLDHLLVERGRLPPAQVLKLLRPVTSALDTAHAAGVIHRDLKASNIFIGEELPTPRVTLLDFGIAKLLHEESTVDLSSSVRVGTPSVMSPEQILGIQVDARSDVYALGVLLFRMLVGRPPFVAAASADVQRMHLLTPPPRPSELAPVPKALDPVVARAMAKSPEERFPSAGAFLEALEQAIATAEVRRQPVTETALLAAVYVDVRMDLSNDGDIADAHLDEMVGLLEQAELRLAAAGLVLPNEAQTGHAVLGLRRLPEGDLAATSRILRATREAAESLLDEMNNGSGPAVHVNLSLHVGAGYLDLGGTEARGGGAVTCVSRWAPPDTVFGVFRSVEWRACE